MSPERWVEARRGDGVSFEPASLPDGLLAAFSSRAAAPPEESSPTAWLARRFAGRLGLDGIPIVRATQVHGNSVAVVDRLPAPEETLDAGACDGLVTALPGVALVVQTADCVPILLAGQRAIGAVHAGWRGSAINVTSKAVAALVGLGERREQLTAWLGPAIGPCCYEVGGDVAAEFAGAFLRHPCGGTFRLDLCAVNRSQLEQAGVGADRILAHPGCTRCGGDKYASYRRDGARAGRMIALIARRELSVVSFQ